MPTVYRSKIDKWLLAIIVAAMAAAGFGIFSAVAAGGPGLWWVVLLPGVVGIGLPVWVLTSTRYTLDGDTLRVQSGPFKWTVPVHDITSITPTSNPLASPALSLDRLRIEYSGGRSVMVSPEDKERFIRGVQAVKDERYSAS